MTDDLPLLPSELEHERVIGLKVHWPKVQALITGENYQLAVTSMRIDCEWLTRLAGNCDRALAHMSRATPGQRDVFATAAWARDCKSELLTLMALMPDRLQQPHFNYLEDGFWYDGLVTVALRQVD